MLRFTLDTTPATASEVQDRLDELARQSFPGEADPAEALLAHGRLLHDLLPTTDNALKAILSVPHARDQEVLRAMLYAQQSASRRTARQFRLLLYAASLLLVGLLVYVGLQLQARSRALRRRAAFEHLLASISMNFVTAQGQEIRLVMENALAQIAQWAGAERAYVLISDDPSAQSYAWNSPAAPFTPGWPGEAFALVDRFCSATDGIVHVPNVRRMPSGGNKDALIAAGLQGWACVVRHATGDIRILLGFDAVTHPCRILPAGELSLLRMALDAITNTLGREASEQERARLERRLQQARRLETVGTLASGIVHNFNNIIGAILGYTEMADERHLSSDIVDGIRRAGERARELVDQILSFARPGDVERSPVSVQALVAETTALLRVSLPAAVELVVDETSEELIVSGVHAQLQQVILNLCSNAAQAMNSVGRILLNVAACDVATARSLSHGMLPPGPYARIAVNDSGRGIEEEVLKRIFEPFFTTRLTGNGLGLATARNIVREHRGAINVESIVGAGSRFEVWLPHITTAGSTADNSVAMLPFGLGETVLIVEDDAQRLLRDEEILAALGYEPVGCTRATDALAMFCESPGRFDVAMVGPLTSPTAALDLATALHEGAARLPILLATASVGGLGANVLLDAGISDVVRWPIIATEIAAALRACLRSRSPREEDGVGGLGVTK
jgi:signal transduction histidine kinase